MTKVLSRKEIFKAKFFSVIEDKIVLPTGGIKTYHNVKRGSAVSVFPVDDKFNIFLVDQFRYGYESRLIESVAGMVEEKDSLETAKQELLEEAGMKASTWRKIAVIKIAGSVILGHQILFLAQGLTFGKQMLEESEDINVIKMPLDKAVKKVLDNEINTGSTSLGIMIINKMKERGEL